MTACKCTYTLVFKLCFGFVVRKKQKNNNGQDQNKSGLVTGNNLVRKVKKCQEKSKRWAFSTPPSFHQNLGGRGRVIRKKLPALTLVCNPGLARCHLLDVGSRGSCWWHRFILIRRLNMEYVARALKPRAPCCLPACLPACLPVSACSEWGNVTFPPWTLVTPLHEKRSVCVCVDYTFHHTPPPHTRSPANRRAPRASVNFAAPLHLDVIAARGALPPPL